MGAMVALDRLRFEEGGNGGVAGTRTAGITVPLLPSVAKGLVGRSVPVLHPVTRTVTAKMRSFKKAVL